MILAFLALQATGLYNLRKAEWKVIIQNKDTVILIENFRLIRKPLWRLYVVMNFSDTPKYSRLA